MGRSRPAAEASGEAEPLEKAFEGRRHVNRPRPRILCIAGGWNEQSAFLAVNIAFIHNEICGRAAFEKHQCSSLVVTVPLQGFGGALYL